MIQLPARFIVRFRFHIIAVWVVVAAVAIPHASRVQEVLQVESGTIAHSEAARANRLIEEAFPRPVSNFFAITVSAPAPIDSPRTRALIEELTATAADEEYVTSVVSYLTLEDPTLISDDRTKTFIVVVTDPSNSGSDADLVPVFRQAVHSAVESFDRPIDIFMRERKRRSDRIFIPKKDSLALRMRAHTHIATKVGNLIFQSISIPSKQKKGGAGWINTPIYTV